jgi:hypothetical protein
VSGKRNADAVRDLWTFFPCAGIPAEVDISVSLLLSMVYCCCCVVAIRGWRVVDGCDLGEGEGERGGGEGRDREVKRRIKRTKERWGCREKYMCKEVAVTAFF